MIIVMLISAIKPWDIGILCKGSKHSIEVLGVRDHICLNSHTNDQTMSGLNT